MAKTATKAPEWGVDFKNQIELTPDLLERAKEQAGEIADEDRISGNGLRLPTYQVVGVQAKDALYLREVDGEEVQASRAGHFRLYQDGEVQGYLPALFPVVVLAVKTAQEHRNFENKIDCRGLSAEGLYKPVVTGRSEFWAAGYECERCPLYTFQKNPFDPNTGDPVGKEQKCKRNLVVYVWNPQADPDGKDPRQVIFSSSSINVGRDWWKSLEQKGVKPWSLWWGLKTQHHKGENGNSDYYTPQFALGGANNPLPKEQVEVAERLRASLLEKLHAQMVPRQAPALAEGQAPSQQPALPSGEVVEAELVDPFVEE